jgi:hypothetical protein
MPNQTTENAQSTTPVVRSIPRHFYVQIRCLHCGQIESVNARSMVDITARRFLARMNRHTAETGHKVEVTTTESFWIAAL